METKTRISTALSKEIEHVYLSKMEKHYTLVYTGYEDHFEGQAAKIQQCLNVQSNESLSEDIFSDRMYSEAQDIIESLTASIFRDERCSHLYPYIEDWIENDNNIETIRFEIYDRDTSDPVKEMVDRTILRSRATLFTNYDCLPHNYDMGNTYSYDDYFKDIVDVLCLNPALVKKEFIPKEDFRINRNAMEKKLFAMKS